MKKLLSILTALILATALPGAANDLNLSQVKPGGIGNDGKQIPMENAITNGSLASFHEAIDMGLTDSPAFTGLTLSGLSTTRVPFLTTGGQFTDSASLTFNSGTGALSATSFVGTVSQATNSTNIGITDDTTTNATMYPLWVTAATGNLPAKVSSTKLTFNPSTGALATTGPLSGGAITGTTGTFSGLLRSSTGQLKSSGFGADTGSGAVIFNQTESNYILGSGTQLQFVLNNSQVGLLTLTGLNNVVIGATTAEAATTTVLSATTSLNVGTATAILDANFTVQVPVATSALRAFHLLKGTGYGAVYGYSNNAANYGGPGAFFGTVINEPANVIVNNAVVTSTTATGLAVTGTLSASGNATVGGTVANNSLTVSRSGANASSIILQGFTNQPSIEWTATSGGLRFVNGVTEYMSLSTTGLAVTGTLGVTYAGAGAGTNITNSDDTSGTFFTAFKKGNGTTIGSVSRVALTDAVVYTTTSDENFKTGIKPVNDAEIIAAVEAAQVVLFKWKADGTDDLGVTAQGLAASHPLWLRIHAVLPGSVRPGYDYATDQARLDRVLARKVAYEGALKEHAAEVGRVSILNEEMAKSFFRGNKEAHEIPEAPVLEVATEDNEPEYKPWTVNPGKVTWVLLAYAQIQARRVNAIEARLAKLETK